MPFSLSMANASHVHESYYVRANSVPTKSPSHLAMNISCYIEGDWYVTNRDITLEKLHPELLWYLNVPRTAKDIAIYDEKDGQEGFELTKQTLADVTQAEDRFDVWGHKIGFYLVLTKSGSKVWINEKDVISVTMNSIDPENSLKLVSSTARNIKYLANNLETCVNSNKLAMTLDLDSLLKFEKDQYFRSNCGIHALLASLVMLHPEKLDDMIKQPDMLQKLEKSSLSNNQVRLAGFIRMAGGVGISLGVRPMVYSSLAPEQALQEFFRENVGIMPKKLVDVGKTCLEMLDLDQEHEIVWKKENNFANLIDHWENIIKSGSPIIALLRAGAFEGHYIVVYGVSENEFYYWGFNGGLGFHLGSYISKANLEKEIDSYKNSRFKASALLGGIDARFNYLYFKNQ